VPASTARSSLIEALGLALPLWWLGLGQQ